MVFGISLFCSSRKPRSAPVEKAAQDFLIRLLETPSASGYEEPVQRLVRDYLAGCAETIETDSHGNVIGTANPGGKTRMFLAGHCDQIGLIVQHIDSDGYISVQPKVAANGGQHLPLRIADTPPG
jgi:hypothetical protein